MSNLRISEVENGFIVQEEGMHPEHMMANPNEIHVFNNPEDMSDWVGEYYIGLERAREDEKRRTQQVDAEEHNE